MKPRSPNRLTIYDISRLAKVSTATVSRAMNVHTRHQVAPRTLKTIQTLAQQRGYTPHLAARYLGARSYRTIGVVLSHFPGVFTTSYHVRILAGVADALYDTSYGFKLILLKPSQQHWDRYNFRTGEAVDGLIVTHWRTFFSEASVFERLALPCVVLNDPEPRLPAHCVTGDNHLGGELVARYLSARGHRHAVVMAGPACSADSLQRLEGFKAVWLRSGTRAKMTVLHGEFQEAKAQQVAEEYLSRAGSATAFFCLNDQMAFGVLQAVRARGLRCPQDISVLGYDDEVGAALSDPPLTTVRVPLEAVAKDGVARLVRHLEGAEQEGFLFSQTQFPVELVERESVRSHR